MRKMDVCIVIFENQLWWGEKRGEESTAFRRRISRNREEWRRQGVQVISPTCVTESCENLGREDVVFVGSVQEGHPISVRHGPTRQHC